MIEADNDSPRQGRLSMPAPADLNTATSGAPKYATPPDVTRTLLRWTNCCRGSFLYLLPNAGFAMNPARASPK